jgi:hypothetical protein
MGITKLNLKPIRKDAIGRINYKMKIPTQRENTSLYDFTQHLYQKIIK